MTAGRLVLPALMPARDRNGRLVPGARMRVWNNKTTTNAAIYSDADLTTPIPNPVTANSSGVFPSVWAEGGTDEAPVLYTLAFNTFSGSSFSNPSAFDDVRPVVSLAVTNAGNLQTSGLATGDGDLSSIVTINVQKATPENFIAYDGTAALTSDVLKPFIDLKMESELEGVSPFIARGNLSLGDKRRSAEDISTGLSSSAYASAMEAYIQDAIDEGGEFLIPANTFTLSRGLVLEGICTIRAHPSSLMICQADQPNFTFDMTAGRDGGGIYGLRAANSLGSLANTNTSAVRIEGNCGGGSGLLEHFDLEDITSTGMYSTIDIDVDTYASAFGQESRYNNSQIKNIRSLYSPGVLNAKYGLLRRQGSGTGIGLKWLTGNIARTASIPGWDTDALPAHVRDMGGVGVVVGDVTYEVGQVTALSAAAYSVNNASNYLSRIKLFGGQIDAQATHAVRFTGSGTNPVAYWDVDVGLGGAAKLFSNPPMFRDSHIVQRSDDVQSYSIELQNLPTGSNSILIATVDLETFDGTLLKGNVAGVVQGVSGGIFSSERLVSTNATLCSSSILVEGTQGTASANFFKLTFTPNGRTMEIRLTYVASAVDSSCRVNLTSTGGTRRLNEIPYP